MSAHYKATPIEPSIFKAYDIRGIVNETLTEDAIYQIGLAFGSEAAERGEQTVYVARDGRLSGPALIKAFTQGLLDSGRDVVDVGMVPTPVLYFAAYQLGTGSGIMLTGSHNATQLPVVLLGRGGGQLETGRVLDYLGQPNRKMCSLYLSLMDKFAVRLEEFGDSRERLADV